VPSEAKFCDRCGSAIEARCERCGHPLRPGARFCSECGGPVQGASPSPPAIGELRTVSVLFADMAGSVATFHATDAESATDRVNQILEAMVAAVADHGGTVDRFLGDGLLALFGATEAREDDPVRAVRAALDLCHRVADLDAAATAGINTGGVYVGEIGSASHRETTAIGPVVNLAARLQGQATAGEVMVSAATARLCGERFDLEPRRLAIKGIPDPVDAFLVTGEATGPTRGRGAGVGGQISVVGRDDELGRLGAAMEHLRDGQGSVALLVGDAGLGKSTLVEEALRQLPPDVTVLEGRCLESGTAAFHPFVDALRGHLTWGPSTVPAERAADVSRMVALADADEVAAHALANLLGAGEERSSPVWAQLPPLQRQRETFRAVRLLLQGMLGDGPVVLVLEDLHWADGASLALVGELLPLPNEHPLAVVCTLRPLRDHPSWMLAAEADARCPTRTVQIVLTELDEGVCEALVADLLGTDRLPDDVRPAVLERAQGNPLFLREFVRSAVESGWLRQTDDGWRVDDTAGLGPVPDTLELIVRARTDRLPEPVRRVLQLAALQGRIFSSTVLTELEGDQVVSDALRVLEERGLAGPARDRSADEWAFSHVLVQETVEQGVLRRVRPALHARLLGALEAIHGTRVEEHAALLAHHAEAAGDADRAVRYLWAAAMDARSSHLNETAAELSGRALGWAEQAETDARSVAELHELRGDVLHVSGQHDEAVSHYETAATMSGPDPLRRARLARKSAAVAVVQRRYDEALPRFDRARALLEDHRDDEGSVGEWIDIHLARAGLHYWRNEPEAIGEALEAVQDDVARDGTEAQRSEALQIWMMRRLREVRYLVSPEIVAVAEESAAIASRWADPGFRAFKRFNLAFCRLWARDLDAALVDFDEAISDGERAGDVVVLSRCHTYAAVAHRFGSDEAGCARATARAEDAARSGEMVEYLAAASANHAWLARRRGDHAEVRRLAEGAIAGWGDMPLVFGFQWMARLPLLAVARAEGDEETVRAQAEFVLSPSQQRLPAQVEEPLAAGAIDAALDAATMLGLA
jgi:class 3 adenylate cyclase/tetratricopeptide (TPR) repeat protein